MTADEVGTSSESEKVLQLVAEYTAAMQMDRAGRDAVRQRLLADDYFYMGIDGVAVGKSEVMARQARNELQIDSIEVSDISVHLHGDAALVTMRMTNTGSDKGRRFSGTSGLTIAAVRRAGTWLIAGDTMGREVAD